MVESFEEKLVAVFFLHLDLNISNIVCKSRSSQGGYFVFVDSKCQECAGCVFYFVMLDLCSGEDSGKVMIWNMAPVLREEDEKNESIPKMLCQMDNHLGKMSPLKCLLVTNEFLDLYRPHEQFSRFICCWDSNSS